MKAGKVPRLPATEKLLPWPAALAACQEAQPPVPALPRALYNHWLKRRKRVGGGPAAAWPSTVRAPCDTVCGRARLRTLLRNAC